MQTFAFEAFQGLSGRLVLLGLLHGLWIGLLVASLLALAFQVGPRLSHQVRYPPVHWLSGSLRRQCEFCADALAVRLTGDPMALAGALESAARIRLSALARPALGAALGGQTFSVLPRIQELLGMTPSRPRPRFWPFAALSAAGLIAFMTVASGLSQDQPSAGRAHDSVTVGLSGGPTQSVTSTAKLASPPDSPTARRAPPASNNQISYAVMFIDLNGETWHDLLGARPKRVTQDAAGSAWIVAQRDVTDFLKRIANKNTAKILQAPKVTTFENRAATIFTSEQYFLAVLQKTKGPHALAALKESESPQAPQRVPANNVGSVVEISGSILPDAMRLSAELHDSSLVWIDELAGTVRLNERLSRVSCEIPTGSCLALSLRSSDQKDMPPQARKVANESIGTERVEAEAARSDRLVLITSRAIVLEPEGPMRPAINGWFDDHRR